MLNKAAEEGRFAYHAKCESSKLTHLCFADDLLIFTDGSLSSVQAILGVLHEFQLHSGLSVSLQKTSMFSSGLSPEEVTRISSSTGLSTGVLPVRYLGVPLSSKKLTVHHCGPLIHHIKGKISSWSARSLSYAGRLLLLNTVVAGITNFWTSTFIIPKSCMRQINSLCSSFLWHGTVEGSHSARVSWDAVTLSKDEGGLGCRDLLHWNKACTIRLIWLLFTSSGSIWVAWFKSVILSGDLSNFWTIKQKQTYSWYIRKMLSYRETAYSWIKMKIGSGSTVRFWTDNWSHLGKLEDYLHPRTTNSMGIPSGATLADIHNNGQWMIRSARSEKQVEVQCVLSSITLSTSPDSYEWEVDGQQWPKYRTGEIYKLLKEHRAKVTWHKVVWSKSGIPKHNFQAWLAVLNRLPTKDRLLSWNLPVSPLCLLCNNQQETRDHLFFSCPFSYSIWSHLAGRCQITPSDDWQETLSSMETIVGPQWKRTLITLVWQLTIYSILIERNHRLHRSTFKSLDSIITCSDSIIRNRIQSLRDQSPTTSSQMMQFWLASSS